MFWPPGDRRQGNMKTISVVTPCYNEEASIEHCYLKVKEVFATALPSYRREHIFADNNSQDATPEILRRIAATDPDVRVIYNSRNFGPLASNFNALLAATGHATIVFMPADLQDPPDLIPTFVRLWEAGNEVVYGIRRERQESALIRGLRSLFYRFVTAWTPFPVPRDAGEFQLIDRQVQRALQGFDDYYPYIRGMIAYCGFKSIGVPYAWQVRGRGLSKATTLSYIDQAMNGLINFNNFPLRFCMVLGLTISFLSFGLGLYSLIAALFFGSASPGIPTLIVSQFFLSGVLLFVIGILSEYVYAIYSLVRRRPLVIERERLNFGHAEATRGTAGAPASLEERSEGD